MDRARKSRGPVRKKVTRACRDIDAEIASLVPSKEILLTLKKKLEAAKQQLLLEDEKVKDAMLDDGKTEQELEQEDIDNEAYYDNITGAEAKIVYAVNPQTVIPLKTMTTSAGGGCGDQRSYKLPKIELPKFNGDLKTWLGWWSQFEKIDKDKTLHNSDKFQYLLQATEDKSKPREIVSAFPPTGDNYAAAIDSLKRRYGREGLQLQVYLRELLNLVIANVTKKEKIPLDKLYMKLESHIRALNTLDLSKAEPSMYFYPLVESSLPEDVLRTWLRNCNKEGQDDKKSKLEDLLDFIKTEVEGEQQIYLAQNAFQDKLKVQSTRGAQMNKKKTEVPTVSSLYTGSYSACVFCGKTNHSSTECFSARKMTLEDRKKALLKGNCCFNCLKKGHRSGTCKLLVSCFYCNKPHQTIMCGQSEQRDACSPRVEEVPGQVNALTVQSPDLSVAVVSSVRNPRVVLMKTLLVLVKGESDEERLARLLFDEGSQRSYIRTELAETLNCKKIGELKLQNCLFGGQVSGIKQRNQLRLQIRGSDISYARKKKNVTLVNEHTLASSCPTIPQGPWIEELARKRITVTDTDAGSPEVDILIGSDLWGTLMTGKMIKLKCGLVAVESVFGWTVSEEIRHQVEESLASLVTTLSITEEKMLPDLWSLEVIGIKDSPDRISQEEEDLNTKNTFQDGITRNDDGRYVVKLPWTCDSAFLPSNQGVAEKHLLKATQKLENQHGFETYDKIFRDWLEEGIIDIPEAVTENQHFLLHRAVYKPESLTTPVRPVFNGSFKIGKGPSLNDCLTKGPNLMELIPSVLLKFREKKIGVVSDIRKAFQMIEVNVEDANYQKFLWWESADKRTVKEYRHRRVVFGLSCSPFILAAVLDFHLRNVKEEDKLVAELLKKSLYVDKSGISFDTPEEYVSFREKATRILSEGKFELRQWETNLDVGEERIVTSFLGLNWDKKFDILSCPLPEKVDDVIVTKRSVLSFVSRIYDPIGMLCPATLQPKILVQQSWIANTGWDEEWSGHELDKFKKWRDEVDALGEIGISRHAFGDISRQELQFHCFTDASQSAYAAIVFVRIKEGDQVSLQLLGAKTRLAPISKKSSKVTIPRLELLGCSIGSILMDTIRRDLSMESVPVWYWSDSTTALAWIRRQGNWGTFVGNRVATIRRLTRGDRWFHVPGVMNPADLPSRGCSLTHLLQSRWWEGPDWLYQDEDQWPNAAEEANEEEISEEVRKTPVVSMLVQEHPEPRFSSYWKNIRVAAWIRRFVNNCRVDKLKRSSCRWPTHLELEIGEKDVIREVQHRHFRPDTKFKSLHTERREDGLLSVLTRLTYKKDWDDFKKPILLPSNDPIVEQLVVAIHRVFCHAGTQFVLNFLRNKYWIIHGRKTVGRIISKCVTCRKYSSKSYSSVPAPLPQHRVELQAAFQTTGVDLAGPLILKGGKKAWIVIFTDAVYRGVHLDWVESLSTEDFIDSLEKFTHIVGRPSILCSDNGTNFVGAQNLMKKLDWVKLEPQLSVKQIQWIFNPPAAAWWGGWWERLVRTIKELLRRMLGKAKLTSKGLTSCLAAVSYVINNRPLTTMNEDAEDLAPLTPWMFMRDLALGGLPERESITTKDLQDQYKKIQDLKRALKERFRKEYLSQLVQRSQEKSSPPPVVGHVVLVEADNRKRWEWPLGRIIEVFPGRDGNIRVVKVKKLNGIFVRPIQRIHPLEVPEPAVMPKVDAVVQEKHDTEDAVAEDEEDTAVYRTRSGREVKKTQRYGSWNI